MKSPIEAVVRRACSTLVLLAALAASGAAEAAKILRVGPGQTYATIQAAVDAATHGDRIYVYPATYPEMVSVLKDHLEIVAQGSGVVVDPPDLAGFFIAADHVTVQGFEIAFGGSQNCATAIMFAGRHNRFAGNLMRQAHSCPGVNVIRSADPTARTHDNVIEHNVFHHADIGISIATPSTTAVNKGNVIRDNLFVQIATTAIAIYNGVDFLVSGNTIAGSIYAPCISIGNSPGNTVMQGRHWIVDNTLAQCAMGGISIFANDAGAVMTHNRIEGNDLSECGMACIDLWPDAGATLSDNEIVGNDVHGALGTNGIQLRDGADHNKIRKNLVSENALWGIVVAGDDNLIEGNRGWDNGTGDFLDAGVGNRWRKNVHGAP